MLHLTNDNSSLFVQTENLINRLREVRHEIKILEAEETRILDSLKKGYFENNISFIGSEGLELATYKPIEIDRFMQSEFKKDYPIMYKDYSVKVMEKRFNLKKV